MGFNLTIQDYPHYTYKDYEKWEGDWELIRGIPYAMSPSPNRHHQRFGSRFVTAFSNALEKNAGTCNCEALYETDWLVTEDTVVRPDVLVVCDNLTDKFITAPPVLVLEILSPSTILKDRNTKFHLYQAYGVRYYLIADLEKKQVEVFHLKDNVYRETNEANQFTLNKDCVVNISVNSLFI